MSYVTYISDCIFKRYTKNRFLLHYYIDYQLYFKIWINEPAETGNHRVTD